MSPGADRDDDVPLTHAIRRARRHSSERAPCHTAGRPARAERRARSDPTSRRESAARAPDRSRRENTASAAASAVAERVGEVARAREEVRLERGDDPPARVRRARRLDRGRDLGRMVRVVVDDRDAAHIAEVLEATLDAAELERGPRAIASSVTPSASPAPIAASAFRTLWWPGTRSSTSPSGLPSYATENEVNARRADVFRRCASRATQARVARLEPVPNDLRARREIGRLCAPASSAQSTIVGAPRTNRANVVADVLEVAVDVEVVGLDVRHDGDRRRQREERPVVFVGFDDEELVRLVAEIARPTLATRPPTIAGRLEPGRRERGGRHHGRRRLAVRAGDADQASAAGTALPERLGAPR